ncbi:MAG: deoxyguanosinetriphosphate triphosphohydrolase [Firmicutes bacterium]|nr:deoxyguanosinetriphosphate triphosphohydrolase [Bacillota bacterium]
MNIRELYEKNEKMMLAPYAKLSCDTAGRAVFEEPDPMRTEFSRDRDRIIHCKAFRRLKQKTQVFLSPEGDHYRTRLTHTLEVAQIARTIARALRLNEDLTEAIALGHDLGHTPFGHAGERALSQFKPGGFRHYEQSVRVVTKLEKDHRGLNLTKEVINGIARHTTGEWADTYEGRIVRLSDHIAYLNHDIEDAITAGVLTEEEIPEHVHDVLGDSKSKRITTLVNALVYHFDGDLNYPTEIAEAYDQLKDFMFEHVYFNLDSDAKKEEKKVEGLIGALFEHYCRTPDAMPVFYQKIGWEEDIETAVADYISGMSDAYAVRCFDNLYIPKFWKLQ